MLLDKFDLSVINYLVHLESPTFDEHKLKHSEKGEHKYPKWIFTPKAANKQLIGIDENATVVFPFSNIISLTAPGHTQMIVTFKDFNKTKTKRYTDEVFVLDIVKEDPPLMRGVVNFFCPEPEIKITNKEQINPKVWLKWNRFKVARVDILTNYPNVPKISIPPPSSKGEQVNSRSLTKKGKETFNDAVFGYNTTEIEIPNVIEDTIIPFTIIARGKNEAILNSKQCLVFATADFFYEPKFDNVYSVKRIGNRIWMTQDLELDKETLHTYDTALNYLTKGWRLPKKKDWEDLYHASNKMDIKFTLKGRKSISNAFKIDERIYGYYWTGDVVLNKWEDKPLNSLLNYVMCTDASNFRYIGEEQDVFDASFLGGEIENFSFLNKLAKPIHKKNRLAVRYVKDI